MTKKDYIVIADAVRIGTNELMYASVNTGETKRAVEHIASRISLALSRDNSRYDSSRFLKACGIVESEP